MICYVIGEKTAESHIEKSADCAEYIGYLINLTKEVILLKNEGYKHFVLCSDSEFVDDFHKAVLYFCDSTVTVELGSIPENNTSAENDIIFSICDGVISRKAL